MQHLAMLNLSLQGRNKLVSDLGQKVFNFKNKLKHLKNTKNVAVFDRIRNKNNCDNCYTHKLEFILLKSKNDFKT